MKCKYCNKQIDEAIHGGEQACDFCWEVESRLQAFCTTHAARAFVRETLESEQTPAERHYSDRLVREALDLAFAHFRERLERATGLVKAQAELLDIDVPDNIGRVQHIEFAPEGDNKEETTI